MLGFIGLRSFIIVNHVMLEQIRFLQLKCATIFANNNVAQDGLSLVIANQRLGLCVFRNYPASCTNTANMVMLMAVYTVIKLNLSLF